MHKGGNTTKGYYPSMASVCGIDCLGFCNKKDWKRIKKTSLFYLLMLRQKGDDMNTILTVLMSIYIIPPFAVYVFFIFLYYFYFVTDTRKPSFRRAFFMPVIFRGPLKLYSDSLIPTTVTCHAMLLHLQASEVARIFGAVSGTVSAPGLLSAP